MSAPTFDLAAEIERATAAYLSLEGPYIPKSVRDVEESVTGWPFRNAYCYECGSRDSVTGFGRFARCGPCHASERQQARIEAAEARREERYDQRGDE